MSTDRAPDISVVIVSWNVRVLLAQCLDSLLAIAGPEPFSGDKLRLGQRVLDVWVVDNASHDATLAMLADQYPWVHAIDAGQNLGFTGGNNLALQACCGRYALLLNPDTVVMRVGDADAITLLADVADAAPDVAVVGPRLLYGDGSPQSSRRRFPTLCMGLMESTPLERWFPHNRWARRYRMEDLPADQVQEVDWVTGACMLVRREALVQVGLFDEGYFMYSEELDLCRRLRAAGWRVVHEPRATVVHYEGQSSGQVLTRRQLLFDSSKVRYFRQHVGAGQAAVLRYGLLAGYAIEMLIEGLKWLLGHKRPLRHERLRAYRDLLRSGLGPPPSAKG
ncbi:MAG: glycosyltransferase family 2 protein [Anaerolineae bacterium]|jgi:N-acetylglucosaminyl-diphospho-decaprenol L-rhamnosyltransferase